MSGHRNDRLTPAAPAVAAPVAGRTGLPQVPGTHAGQGTAQQPHEGAHTPLVAAATGQLPSVAAYPLAPPIRTGSEALSAQVNGQFTSVGDPKDADPSVRVAPATLNQTSATSPPQQRRPLADQTAQPAIRFSQQRLARMAGELPQRDQQTLSRIAEHGYLSTDLVQRFVFTDHATLETAARTTRRVLRRLERTGLIASLPRRQGGPLGGSTPQTWHLTPGGARLTGGPHTAYRRRTPSIRWLLHCLAVAETHLALRDHTTTTATDVPSTLSVQVEPEAWRTFAGPGGDRRILKPDLWAARTGTDAHGYFRDECLIEVDLGTESLATLVKKCHAYLDYYRSGAWHTTPESVMPIVLWILPDTHRATRLRNTVRRTITLPGDLFRYATPDTLADHLHGEPPAAEQETAPTTNQPTDPKGGTP